MIFYKTRYFYQSYLRNPIKVYKKDNFKLEKKRKVYKSKTFNGKYKKNLFF